MAFLYRNNLHSEDECAMTMTFLVRNRNEIFAVVSYTILICGQSDHNDYSVFELI